MFERCATITDIHYGRRANDKQANQDNEDFLRWFIAEAKSWGATTCVMMGDWHDNRHSLHVSTLHYSLRGMKLLNDAFERVYFIIGNHDIFFRERRDLISVEFATLYPNLILVNDPLTVGDVTFLPWLVGDELKKMKALKSRYVFSHLELPGFKMNQMVEMPDHGGLNARNFPNQEYVFSGHFHLRQSKGNVHYTGNVFPFNYNDAWDTDRGCMLLEWGGTPIYRAWPEQPTFRTMTLSQLVEDPDKYLIEKSSAKVTIDLDISFEESTILRDDFCKRYGVRRIDLVNAHHDESEEFDGNVEQREIHTVDQIVIEGLQAVESVGLRPGLLVEIYQSLTA